MFLRTNVNTVWSSTHDARLVILARALRTFGYGFTSVLLAVMLEEAGVPTWQIGILLGVAALGSITFSLVMGIFADRVGRKRLLVISAVLMMMTGCTFALTDYYPLLLLAAFFGTISPSTNDNTPFSGIEQAILAQSCEQERHATLYAVYNLIAQLAGALGGLAVGLSGVLAHVAVGPVSGPRWYFVMYGLLAASTALIFLRLTPEAELQQKNRAQDAKKRKRGVKQVPQKRRKAGKLILKLSSLFALDAFAGGLAVQSILSLWFKKRFGVSVESLGLLFFGVNTRAACSMLLAPVLTKRLGLLKTMIGPHVISNILLVLVPVMPSFPLAAVCLLGRQSLSKVDVPARMAFTAALVSPEEQTAAASFTTIARSVAVSVSPLVAGLMIADLVLMFGLPMLLAGGIELWYDAAMWKQFHKVKLYPHKKEEPERKIAVRKFEKQFRSMPTSSGARRWLTMYPESRVDEAVK